MLCNSEILLTGAHLVLWELITRPSVKAMRTLLIRPILKVMGKLLPLIALTSGWGSQTALVYPTNFIHSFFNLIFFNFNFLLLFNYSSVPFLPIPPPHSSNLLFFPLSFSPLISPIPQISPHSCPCPWVLVPFYSIPTPPFPPLHTSSCHSALHLWVCPHFPC